MQNTTKFFLLFVTGLIITAGAAGGLDTAETLQDILALTFTAGLGLLAMYLSTIYVKE